MENKQDLLIAIYLKLMDEMVQAQRDFDKVLSDTKGSEIPFMALDLRGRLNDTVLQIHGALSELTNENMY